MGPEMHPTLDRPPPAAQELTQRQFDEAHAEALVEGVTEVMSTLRAFKDVLSKHQPTRSDFGTARILLERARKELESFDVKDDE